MNVYVESSAVLAWLFGEAPGAKVADVLDKAETLISSDLTLVECDRALHRAAALGVVTIADAAKLRSRLAAAHKDWNILHLTAAIVARARQPFPNEPVRTLDALHVASALHARGPLPALALLSLDDRVRKVGASLGFALAPM